MRVHPPPADDVSPGRRQLDLTAAREQRPREKDRGADLSAEHGVETRRAHGFGMDREACCARPMRCRRPVDATSSTRVSTSRIRGTFSSVTGWSVRSAAQMIGSAAFLLPDGRTVPESGCAALNDELRSRHVRKSLGAKVWSERRMTGGPSQGQCRCSLALVESRP